MVDIWDLGRYVEDHPEEYEQRWRLAKKLYLACEYRLALEHLQILRNEWTRKLNIVRYLSATLYRLGRYEEAIVELEEAIDIWPDEVGLREQLARVLEVSGRDLEAAEVWDKLAEMAPDHPIASRAAKRLRGEVAPAAPEQEELHIRESDSGIDLSPTRICPNCGAQNTAEFDRCWQCHAALGGGGSTANDYVGPMPLPAASIRERHEPRHALAVVGVVVLLATLSYGGYVAYDALPHHAQDLPVPLPSTLYGALFQSMLTLRLALGAVLLLCWPLVLALGLRMVPSDSPGGGIVFLVGVVLAALAFGALWAPLEVFGTLLLVMAVASLALIAASFGMTLRDTVLVWLLQGIFMAAVALLTFGAIEGFGAIPGIPAAIKYAAVEKVADAVPAAHKAPSAQVSASYAIAWQSTGSVWLDRKLDMAHFVISSAATHPPLAFDLREEGKAVLFSEMTSMPFKSSHRIQTGHPYELNVRGSVEQQGSPLELTVYSYLQPTFNKPEAK